MSFKPLLAVTLIAALAACAQTHTGQPGNGTSKDSRIVQTAPQDAAIHRSKIGAYDLIALNLGTPGLNPELFDGRPFSTTQINEIANRNRAPRMPDGVALQGALNAYLLHTGNRLLVIDAGMADGHTFVDKLRQAGYRPEQVDAVLLTHTHPDHIGGLMTDGKATFSNATVYLSAAESKLDSAHSVLAAYGGRIKTFTAGDALFNSIKTVDLAGHTAGHVGYAPRAGQVEESVKERLLVGQAFRPVDHCLVNVRQVVESPRRHGLSPLAVRAIPNIRRRS